MSEEQGRAPEAQTTPEERFFGKSTTIVPRTKDAAIEEEVAKAQKDGESPVEIVDDRPPEDRRPPPAKQAVEEDDDGDELGDYSDKVQKRIKKLTWQREEERRQREAAERMQQEAVRVAQQMAQQNRQLQDTLTHGEAQLVQEIKNRAANAVEAAKAKYRKAYEEGDTDAVIAAQEEMIGAQAQLYEANHYEQDYNRRAYAYQQQVTRQQQPQVQRPQQPQRPSVPQPTERARQWAENNPWFGSHEHKDMTALAYGVHERLVREEGVKPDTEEYFNRLDREMHQRFPEYFGTGAGRQAASTKPESGVVVAPAARNNGAKPRKVKLTATQAALAKKLGLTLEQYASQLLKEQ